MGIKGFLMKPVGISDMARMVRDVLDNKTKHYMQQLSGRHALSNEALLTNNFCNKAL